MLQVNQSLVINHVFLIMLIYAKLLINLFIMLIYAKLLIMSFQIKMNVWRITISVDLECARTWQGLTDVYVTVDTSIMRQARNA